jgi:four helix bundle protein
MGVVLEETDETQFWLELLVDAGIVEKDRLSPLREESEQLVRIFRSSIQTARLRK